MLSRAQELVYGLAVGFVLLLLQDTGMRLLRLSHCHRLGIKS